MFIKNDIVSLRVAEPNDADLIYRWENDMDIWRDSETRVPYSMRQIEQFLLNNNDLVSENQLRLMIENSNGDAVGCIDLYDYDEFNSRAGIGILVDKNHNDYNCKQNCENTSFVFSVFFPFISVI